MDINIEVEPKLKATTSLLEYLEILTQDRSMYYERQSAEGVVAPPDLKVIAYFLPQFHPIPENNAAWGRGFTEWTNVTKAIPQFFGHVKPNLPADLGFYDLRLRETLEQQCSMAKHHGVHGFCFYHYWFGGRSLLDAPIKTLKSNPSIDFPFCLMWANENWTKRWDGMDDEIIVGQNHSFDIDKTFIHDAFEYLTDSRYIRIDGKPVVAIYKAHLLPDLEAILGYWREFCLRKGLGEICILVSNASPDATSVYDSGIVDGICEFPPHGYFRGLRLPSERFPRFANPKFSGVINSYANLLNHYLANDYAGRNVYRGVCVNWDNAPRRREAATIFLGSTPALFQQWFERTVSMSRRPHNDMVVFVNAWNEWAESAYLEPDRWMGFGYLNALSRGIRAAVGTSV